MRRREFITGIGAAVTWPFASSAVVCAQQPEKIPTIGFLGVATPAAWSKWVAAFEKRLRELRWIEGRTLTIDYRWAEGRSERFAEIAAEFVRLNVDIIVTAGNAGIAARRATATIPIVLAVANDPVGDGLVASLARPGGNVTGLSAQVSDLAGKRLELLREVFPTLRRLAILANPSYPAAGLELREVRTKAGTLGFDVVTLEIGQSEDIAPAIRSLSNRAEALYVCIDALTITNRTSINSLALAARLPTISGLREDVEAGSLISYGPSISDLFRRAAEYVDTILRGAKPGDLPVEQPTKFDLIINLKTARTLGLDVPAALQTRADEVIE